MKFPELSRLILLHLGLTVAVVLGLNFEGYGGWAASFAIGAGLMQWSCLSFAWVMERVLSQKRFAWTIALIVIKYAVLLGLLYSLARYSAHDTADSLEPLGLVAGVFSFMIAALGFAALETRHETRREMV